MAASSEFHEYVVDLLTPYTFLYLSSFIATAKVLN
jgi:hypothetical protein